MSRSVPVSWPIEIAVNSEIQDLLFSYLLKWANKADIQREISSLEKILVASGEGFNLHDLSWMPEFGYKFKSRLFFCVFHQKSCFRHLHQMCVLDHMVAFRAMAMYAGTDAVAPASDAMPYSRKTPVFKRFAAPP